MIEALNYEEINFIMNAFVGALGFSSLARILLIAPGLPAFAHLGIPRVVEVVVREYRSRYQHRLVRAALFCPVNGTSHP